MELVRADALYQQLAKVVRDAIAQGEYPPGSLLPSEAVLADRYKVSRPTVRLALSALRAEGLVAVRMGKGSFVRPGSGAPVATVHRDATSADRLTATGEPRSYRQDLDARTAGLLGLEPGDPVLVQDADTAETVTGRRVLTRWILPLVSTEGTSLETDHFPDRAAMMDILTRAHGTLTEAEYVRARMPQTDESDRLGLSDITPLIETVRITSAASGPLVAEVEIASAEGIQYAYPLHTRV